MFLVRLIRSFANSTSGAAAVEFAIFLPLLSAALISFVDVTRLLDEKNSIDQILRIVAESALKDPGQLNVEKFAQTLISQKFNERIESLNSIKIVAKRFCVCESYEHIENVECDNYCPPSAYHKSFYKIDAVKYFEGMLVREYDISSSVEVQVR